MKALDPKHLVLWFLVFVTLLCLYLPRTALTPQATDGPEFVIAAVVGRVPHAPGYPLYQAINRVLVTIFPENPYHTLAVFSALCQAAAIAALGIVLELAGVGVILALSVAGALGVYPPWLLVATDVEVFGLHHLLLALNGIALLMLWKQGRARDFALSGLLLGFAASHHHTVVLFAPLILGALVAALRHSIQPKFCAALFFVCGGSAVLSYLSLRGGQGVVLPGPQSIAELIRYVLRLSYGSLSLKGLTVAGDRSYLPDLLLSLVETAPLLCAGIMAALIGPCCAGRRAERFLWCLTALLHLWFGYNLVVGGDTAVFGEWVSRFYGIVALFGAAGTLMLSHLVPRRLQPPVAILLLGFSLAQAPRALRAADARHDQVGAWQARGLLAAASEGDIVVADGDRVSMALLFAQQVDKISPSRCVIVRSLFEDSNYRSRLSPECEAVREEQHFDEAIRRTLEAGRTVLSTGEALPPAGVYSRFSGDAWSWSLASVSPERAVVLQFLARIPDELRTLPAERVASFALAGSIYGEPLAFLQQLATSDAERNQAQRVVEAYRRADLASVRHLCRQ